MRNTMQISDGRRTLALLGAGVMLSCAACGAESSSSAGSGSSATTGTAAGAAATGAASQTQAPTPTPTSVETTATGGSSTSGATTTPTATATSPARGACLTKGLTYKGLNLTGVTSAAAAKARQVFQAAESCDRAALVAIATKDKTNLSFGMVSPKEAFVLPQDESKRYDATVQVLSTKPMLSSFGGYTSYVWPRLFSEKYRDDDSAWQEVIDAGLITPAEARLMRTDDLGYIGWRISITTTGDMDAFVAGD